MQLRELFLVHRFEVFKREQIAIADPRWLDCAIVSLLVHLDELSVAVVYAAPVPKEGLVCGQVHGKRARTITMSSVSALVPLNLPSF